MIVQVMQLKLLRKVDQKEKAMAKDSFGSSTTFEMSDGVN